MGQNFCGCGRRGEAPKVELRWRIMILPMRCSLLLLAGAVLAGAGPSLSGHAPAGAPGDIPIRIVVTDSRGRAVSGILAADLEISESGRPQTLQTFAAVKSGQQRAWWHRCWSLSISTCARTMLCS